MLFISGLKLWKILIHIYIFIAALRLFIWLCSAPFSCVFLGSSLIELALVLSHLSDYFILFYFQYYLFFCFSVRSRRIRIRIRISYNDSTGLSVLWWVLNICFFLICTEFFSYLFLKHWNGLCFPLFSMEWEYASHKIGDINAFQSTWHWGCIYECPTLRSDIINYCAYEMMLLRWKCGQCESLAGVDFCVGILFLVLNGSIRSNCEY